MRIIVGITGATGAIFGIRLLEELKDLHIETHLILSKWAEATIKLETDYSVKDVRLLASCSYAENDQAASISSGSFLTDGMVIAPCSMKTLAGIRVGLGSNLISRAADVVLKEQRRLVIVPRETPLSVIHLENMLELARIGVTIFPPVPAFYNHPRTIDDVIRHVTGRVMDQLGIENGVVSRWNTSHE